MTEDLKSTLKAVGCPTCPYCTGDGIIPSPEVMKRIQHLLLAEGYKIGELTRSANVDAGTWSKPIPTPKTPAWFKLWKYLLNLYQPHLEKRLEEFKAFTGQEERKLEEIQPNRDTTIKVPAGDWTWVQVVDEAGNKKWAATQEGKHQD